ncbi:MAG: NADH dehydrogenase [Gammaproteobacteria bacterium RIFCSPHIGHO2_12_FULL_45_9]|nr:MAG: NADH dehydrogenase [Gammaproteobacteria bacterium RIFCSPHIGHO2_12_FULL_45_9]
MSDERFEIAPEVKAEIDLWVAKYPEGCHQSALIAALLLVQQQNGGWLSNSAIQATANYLNLPEITAFEAATFYDLYHLEPIGKHKISVCTNLSCTLRGSDELLACLRQRLGIGPDETTTDGRYTIREVECLAACAGAPMCQVDDQAYHENLTPEKLNALLDQLDANDAKEAHHASE